MVCLCPQYLISENVLLKVSNLYRWVFYNFNTLLASFSFPNLSQMIRFPPAALFSASLFTCKSMIPPSLNTHQHRLPFLANEIMPVTILISSFERSNMYCMSISVLNNGLVRQCYRPKHQKE